MLGVDERVGQQRLPGGGAVVAPAQGDAGGEVGARAGPADGQAPGVDAELGGVLARPEVGGPGVVVGHWVMGEAVVAQAVGDGDDRGAGARGCESRRA